MHRAVVQHAFLGVVPALLVRLGPHVAVELAVALASWARGAREVGVLLDEGLFADLAVDPGRRGFRKEGRRQDVVAGDADGGRMIEIGAGAWEPSLPLPSFLGCDGHG